MQQADPARVSAPGPAVRRRSALGTAVQVSGELLLTAGVLLLLYVAWQLWWTNLDARTRQAEAVQSLAREFGTGSTPDAGTADPVVGQAPGYGQPFGIVYIPRFGPDYSVPVSAGVGADVLDTLGLGMYPGSVMPGGIGNFAVAGHRQTHGKVLDMVHTLVPGDRIYVRTVDGYYTYVFRNFEIVPPEQTDVLLPVPHRPGKAPAERLMTMTTCHPRYGDQQRYIAYSVLAAWQPNQAGPPEEIAAVAAGNGKG